MSGDFSENILFSLASNLFKMRTPRTSVEWEGNDFLICPDFVANKLGPLRMNGFVVELQLSSQMSGFSARQRERIDQTPEILFQ